MFSSVDRFQVRHQVQLDRPRAAAGAQPGGGVLSLLLGGLARPQDVKPRARTQGLLLVRVAKAAGGRARFEPGLQGHTHPGGRSRGPQGGADGLGVEVGRLLRQVRLRLLAL